MLENSGYPLKEMDISRYKLVIWINIGILAYIISDFVHEVLGHSGTCLLLGNKVVLLTSVYFKSQPGSFIVDIGGPIANFLCCIIALTALRVVKEMVSALFLIHLLLYNIFWFAGTVLHSAVSRVGDWTFAIKKLDVGQSEKYVLFLVGIFLYLLIIILLRMFLDQLVSENTLTREDFIFPFLFAFISAFIAGLFFSPDRLHAGLEGMLEVIASFPILFLRLKYASVNRYYKLNHTHTVVVIILYIGFCLTLGRGITF